MQSSAEARESAEAVPWAELEDHLEGARSAILAEIRNYPPPIAACDQQFNYLLEQRDRIADEQSRLASTRLDSLTGESDVEAFVGFIKTSDCIAPELKARLMHLLDQRLGHQRTKNRARCG
jgi:hypothetical protein